MWLAVNVIETWPILTGLAVVIFQAGVLHHKVNDLEKDMELLRKRLERMP